MPNTLDFDVVFTELGRLDQTGNVAVLCTIIIVLLLYLLVVIFARKADKRDQAKVAPCSPCFCKLNSKSQILILTKYFFVINYVFNMCSMCKGHLIYEVTPSNIMTIRLLTFMKSSFHTSNLHFVLSYEKANFSLTP